MVPFFLTWSFGTSAILLAKRQAHVGLHVGDDGRSWVPASEKRNNSPSDDHSVIIYSRCDAIFTGVHKKEDFWRANLVFVLKITS